MATLQSSTMFSNKVTSQIQNINNSRRSSLMATRAAISLQKLPSRSFPNHDNLIMKTKNIPNLFPSITINLDDLDHDRTAIVTLEKMHAVMEAISDRVEMHRNIGQQRDNWNSLLLSSVNSMTLAAAAMSGIASAAATPAAALTMGATVLYLSAAGILSVMNKIQPSQLAEEQRNATRLFEQLRCEIQTKLSLAGGGSVTEDDVSEAVERVLALDRAYPLPLLGAMLEKFPAKVEPAVWWPRKQRKARETRSSSSLSWSPKLEEEMREICGLVERRDVEEYLRLSEKALKLNKLLAVSGPVLTALAAVGTALSGHGAFPAAVGVLGGVLATAVNAVEHGGQVGMVFEMYRSNAGFFKLVEETIESNLKERDSARRENGELFEMKIALQLGRSVSELRSLADKSRSTAGSGLPEEEFASKLF